jgi:hypothetical protein
MSKMRITSGGIVDIAGQQAVGLTEDHLTIRRVIPRGHQIGVPWLLDQGHHSL